MSAVTRYREESIAERNKYSLKIEMYIIDLIRRKITQPEHRPSTHNESHYQSRAGKITRTCSVGRREARYGLVRARNVYTNCRPQSRNNSRGNPVERDTVERHT